MTTEERLDLLSAQVRRMGRRNGIFIWLLACAVLLVLVLLVGYVHLASALGWVQPPRDLKADYLTTRRIDFVDSDGNPLAFIYAHKAVDSEPGIDIDFRSERGQAMITMFFWKGKAALAWSGASEGWGGFHPINKGRFDGLEKAVHKLKERLDLADKRLAAAKIP